MTLKNLNDRELLNQTKELVKQERKILTKILHHLKEVERRKLFSDLGYQSLFAYAVAELSYSEGQAGRRIRALRLIVEIPEVEKKIETGKLSLSNISQAQSYFRESKKQNPNKKLNLADKKKILHKLENKSTREGQRLLMKMQPEIMLPKERERTLTENHVGIHLILTNNQKKSLEELRSLLGPKAIKLTLAELIDYMASQCIQTLREKKFGKKRTQNKVTAPTSPSTKPRVKSIKGKPQNVDAVIKAKNIRYISKKKKHEIWKRDKEKCTNCGTKRNLNIDHIKPIALGGGSEVSNLRLLCFNCNQRQAMKTFGVKVIKPV